MTRPAPLLPLILALAALILTACGGGTPEPIPVYIATAYEHTDVGRMYRYENNTLVIIGSLLPGKEGISTLCETRPNYYLPC